MRGKCNCTVEEVWNILSMELQVSTIRNKTVNIMCPQGDVLGRTGWFL